VGWVDAELGLVALAAMLSPTTLSFSVLALVIGDRPLRTGSWFYLGAMTATLAVGVVAAFVIGDVAASDSSTPKTWVAVVDVAAAVVLALYVVRMVRRPPNPEQAASMIERMGKVAASPAIAIVGAGAALANPGGFIPLALKEISETDPSATEYVTEWVLFSLVALLPLAVALVMLLVARERTMRTLTAARRWLERHARTIAAVLLLLVAAALLRNGIVGLTS
jgi:threonine/homoserine/homoserine lactone efflux protein